MINIYIFFKLLSNFKAPKNLQSYQDTQQKTREYLFDMQFQHKSSWLNLNRKEEALHLFVANFKFRMLQVYDNLCFVTSLYKNKTHDLGLSQQQALLQNKEIFTPWEFTHKYDPVPLSPHKRPHSASRHAPPLQDHSVGVSNFESQNFINLESNKRTTNFNAINSFTLIPSSAHIPYSQQSESKISEISSANANISNLQTKTLLTNVNSNQRGTKNICKKFTCNQVYSSGLIDYLQCKHHSGHFQPGSVKRLWGEHWTCCGKGWNAEGCTVGKHEGEPVDSHMFICVNRGEVNPGRQKPDSLCGAYFKLDEGKVNSEDEFIK